MSETITIHNGGEAPHAAKSIAGAVVPGADQIDPMQQNGGQAPEPRAGGQLPTAPNTQQHLPTGDDAGGAVPLGGGVRSA